MRAWVRGVSGWMAWVGRYVGRARGWVSTRWRHDGFATWAVLRAWMGGMSGWVAWMNRYVGRARGWVSTRWRHVRMRCVHILITPIT